MTKDNAINNIAFKYPTLPEFAKMKGVSMASVLRECGNGDRNVTQYKNHYVVVNRLGEVSLQSKKSVRAFL
jgi:hypothetical protein